MATEEPSYPFIPDWLRPDFEQRCFQYTLMVRGWEIHRQLFEQGDKRIELMSLTAPAFFNIIDDAILRNVALTLAKLSAPVRDKKGRESLSLRGVVALVEKHANDSDLLLSARQVQNRFLADALKLDEFRNRYLAHFDRAVLVTGEVPMPDIPAAAKLGQLIDLVSEFLNVLSIHYGSTTIIFDRSVPFGDADDLVPYLAMGQLYEQLEKNLTINWEVFEKSEFYNA